MQTQPAALLLLSTFGVCLAATPLLAQMERKLVPANLLIPQPPPSAPLSDWTNAADRETISEALEDATLRGWDYGGPAAKAPIVLFFNGNGMTADRSDGLYRSLVRAGAEVVVFDYRGIGFSSGDPDVLTFRQDAVRLFDRVAADHPGRPLVVFGFSLGTAMASYVASQRPVAGLILAGTIATATDEFPVYLHAAGVQPGVAQSLAPAPDAVEAFDEVGNVAKSSAPLLMLHGEADMLVPIAQGRKVFAVSPAPQKRFVALPGIVHNATAGSQGSLAAVQQFLAGLSAGR